MSEDCGAWERVGRDLAHRELEVTAGDLHSVFNQAARKVARDEEELTGRDVEQLYNALEDAEMLVDLLAEVPNGYTRPPRVRELLTPEELQDVVSRSPLAD